MLDNLRQNHSEEVRLPLEEPLNQEATFLDTFM